MSRCREILRDVIERSGMSREDGHPLYAYRITQSELERLRIELLSRFRIAGVLRNDEECAAFCLFASEWFRRKYDRGVWKWQTVFDGFELDPGNNRAAQTNRGDYTIKGLQWWNLDVIRTAASKRYLTSLVCQGGFPLNTLRNDGANLSRVLRRCLRQHELYQTEPINEIVDEYIGYLPETLQEPEVRHLIGLVVVAIADLRRKSDAAAEHGLSRREFLDQQFSNWHSHLPFRIEDPEAQSLLLSLLDASRARTFDRQPLAILTTLVDQEGQFQLQRTLQHPVSIESKDFRSLCRVEADKDLYPRMNGFLSAGEKRVQACTVARPFEGTTLRMQASGAGKLIGEEACLQTSLLIRSGQELVTDARLPGGEALPLSPWVFSADDPFELIGVGSVRTRHPSVYVALPDGAKLQADESEASTQRINGRALYRVSGTAEIDFEESIYRIRTREKDAQDVIYELQGDRRRVGASGKEIWLGSPSVVELRLDETSKPRTLSRQEVSWRPCNGGTWRPIGPDCLGDVFIRVNAEGETKLLTRISVFPPSFRVETRPGGAVGSGQWIVSGLGQGELYFDVPEEIELRAWKQEEQAVIEVNVTGDRPESIQAKFRFSDDAIAELDLVCPTQSCSLVGAGGRIIDARMGIPLEQFDGLRVRLIQPGNQQPYLLELEHLQLIDALSETSPGVWEYPLSFAKAQAIGLLASSDDPDSEIRLGVSVGRSFRTAFDWRVSRYGYRLAPVVQSDQEYAGDASPAGSCISRVGVSDRALRSGLAEESVKVRVIGLNAPKTVLPDNSVVQESPGRWKIDHTDAEPGYYLVTGQTELGDSLRPLRIANRPDLVEQPAEEKPEADYGFDEVSTIGNPERRRETWDSFFARLSVDFGDPDWDKVEAVVAASERLPVTTFEAVSGLTRNPVAVARFGLLHPAKAKMWQRLEELPFLWCLVPISAWITSALRILGYFRKTMIEAGVPEDQVAQTIASNTAAFVKHSPDRHPSMCCVSACLFHAELVDPSLLKLAGVSEEESRHAINGLVRRHERFDIGVRWPRFQSSFSSDVNQILSTTPGLVRHETQPQQQAVVTAPALAAIHAVYDLPLDAGQVRDLKRLRSFDTEWFDFANYLSMYHLVNRRFSDEPQWVNEIVTRIGY